MHAIYFRTVCWKVQFLHSIYFHLCVFITFLLQSFCHIGKINLFERHCSKLSLVHLNGANLNSHIRWGWIHESNPGLSGFTLTFYFYLKITGYMLKIIWLAYFLSNETSSVSQQISIKNWFISGDFTAKLLVNSWQKLWIYNISSELWYKKYFKHLKKLLSCHLTNNRIIEFVLNLLCLKCFLRITLGFCYILSVYINLISHITTELYTASIFFFLTFHISTMAFIWLSGIQNKNISLTKVGKERSNKKDRMSD